MCHRTMLAGREAMDLVVVFFAVVVVATGIASSLSQSNETVQYRYLCPKNFENVGRKCYHFSNGTATWFQAYFSCKSLGDGNFTVFTGRYDQRQLERFLSRNRSSDPAPTSNSYWVGGFKDWKQKKWIYTDGSLVQFPTLKEIHLSQKDSWTCLLIDGNSKRWKAENCMEKRRFVCETNVTASVELQLVNKKVKRRITIDECISNSEFLTKKQKKACLRMLNGRNGDAYSEHVAVIHESKPAYPSQPTVVRAISHICPQAWMALGNQCYLFSKERVTWSDAHFNCGQINAKLAIVRSKIQDQKLRIFLNGFTEKQERWIGGRYNGRTGEWIWALNGKPLKYKGFAKQPPSNTSNDTLDWQAIVMDPQYGYKWTHRNEIEKHFYICQVKGRAVKRLNYPRRPAATIEIVENRRYQRRNQHPQVPGPGSRPYRRANRNKRT